MRLLLGARAVVNQAMNTGATPLFIARRQRQQKCVELLKEAGAVI